MSSWRESHVGDRLRSDFQRHFLFTGFTENKVSTFILHTGFLQFVRGFSLKQSQLDLVKMAGVVYQKPENAVIFALMGREWGRRLNKIQQATRWGALPNPFDLFPQVTFFF